MSIFMIINKILGGGTQKFKSQYRMKYFETFQAEKDKSFRQKFKENKFWYWAFLCDP